MQKRKEKVRGSKDTPVTKVKRHCSCVSDYGDHGEVYRMSSGHFRVTWNLIDRDGDSFYYAADVCGRCFGSGWVEEEL